MSNNKIFDSILDTIGNTPMIRINNLKKISKNIQIMAKCEFLNPFGSIEDRINKEMLLDLYNNNTNNYTCTLNNSNVLSTTILSSYLNKNIDYNIKKCNNNLKKTIHNFFYPNKKKEKKEKKENSINLDIDKLSKQYYLNLSNEIYDDCNGLIDVIFIPTLPNGIITGIGTRLKALIPDIIIIGVSICNNFKKKDTMSIIPSPSDRSIVDIWAEVNNDSLPNFLKLIINNEGLPCGLLSSSVLLSAINMDINNIYKIKPNLEKKTNINIITILPDKFDYLLLK